MTTPEEVVWDIKQKLYEFTKRERACHSTIFELVEAYIIKNKLLLSNPYRLTGLENQTDSLMDFHYVIYCSRPLEHANALVNAIYEKLVSLKDTSRLDTLSMNTAVKNEEFFISYDNRVLVKIFAMQRDRPKGQSVDLAKLVEPVVIDGIPLMPAEIEIIDVYTQLYSEATKMKEMVFFEKNMLETVIGKVGGEVYSIMGGIEEISVEENTFDVKKFMAISGGKAVMNENHEKNIKSCYERKKDELEALKVAIVKEFFVDRKDIALIGPLAVEWEKSKGDICPKYDRIQVVGNITMEELKSQLVSYLETFGKKYEINTSDPLDLLIPKDFRTKRTVFSMSIKTDMGIKEKPFLEFFNSCEFELVPVFTFKGVLLGNKLVSLRFLFIDLWVTKFIYSLGKLDINTYKSKQQRSLELIRDLAALPFKADGTLGIYDDFEIAKKERKINQEQFFYPYFPHAHYKKNNKLRIF